MGVFGCLEVTIGWYGEERVDYLTYDTKGVWRCYEVKSSLNDFNSKSKKTFIGHYNYYVITKDLYEQVKDAIPAHIGIYLGRSLQKRAKKQELQIDENILKNSMIRSLSRDSEKLMKSENPDFINRNNRKLNDLTKERDRYKSDYQRLRNKLYDKFGRNWEDQLEQLK